MKLIDGDKLKGHLDYLIQKERQLAKECSRSPDNEFERQRRYCFEANALAYELCENVMDYYLVADTQVMNQCMDKKDLSQNCDFDDDSGKNDCWHCKYFLFPIGCMYGEDGNDEQEDFENGE